MGSVRGDAEIIIIDSSSDDEERSIQVRRAIALDEGAIAQDPDAIASPDLSPGFRNAAAMAGWDDEALAAAFDSNEQEAASTPEDKGSRKREERTPGQAATPASLNRVHRRPRRPIDETLENLSIQDNGDGNLLNKIDEAAKLPADRKEGGVDPEDHKPNSTAKGTEKSVKNVDAKPACLEELRDELSCAVCLEICFEPSTTSCGHSFCRSCLQSSVSNCGLRCPKCRQYMKEQGAINVVLWNTIQILFPDDVAKRIQSKKEEAEKEEKNNRTSSARNQAARLVAIDRRRPIGNFRRSAPFRPPQRRQTSSTSQQQDLDEAYASSLQEEELRSSSSSLSEIFASFGRLRRRGLLAGPTRGAR